MRRLVLGWRRVLAIPLLNVPASSVFSIVLKEAPEGRRLPFEVSQRFKT